jgi:hypothetical protein
MRLGASITVLSCLVACGGTSPPAAPDAPPPAPTWVDAGAAPGPTWVDAGAAPGPTWVDAGAAPASEGRRVVVARLVSGPRRVIPCGRVAFIGVYVYEVVEVREGAPLTGRVVVDVLCPDMQTHVGLTPGATHVLTLGPARRGYAGATAPASPAPELPRFEATHLGVYDPGR